MQKTKIMVVEDEGIVALSIQMQLENLGYEVPVLAGTGEEAVKQAPQIQPDLVLMDIKLDGELDGIQAATQIRAQLDIPIVYLTANSDSSTLQRAIATEPFGYLLKPFEERELHTSIAMALYKHKLESQLKKREQWLSTVLKSIGDAVITTDNQGYITFMNPVAEALTGWSQATALNQELNTVFKVMDTATQQANERPLKHILHQGGGVQATDQTLVLLTHDNTQIPIETNAAPIMDEAGKVTGAVLVFRNISERKHAEAMLKAYSEQLEAMVAERTRKLQEAQEELVRKERLAVLGQLAGGVAHELRNPLGVVNNAAYFLRLILTEADETVKEYLDIITSRIHDAEKIVADLLNLTRTRPIDRQPIKVETLVTEVLDKHPPAETITVINTVPTDLPPVFVDPRQIEQVLVNLIVNAYQAMPNGGELTCHAWRQSNQVKLSVSDSGCGIAPEILPKIFEPLFSSKPKGIGLGLTVSKNLAEVNGGGLTVSSTEGQGSTFTVTLPIQA